MNPMNQQLKKNQQLTKKHLIQEKDDSLFHSVYFCNKTDKPLQTQSLDREGVELIVDLQGLSLWDQQITSPLSPPVLAVVGSRSADLYGLEVTREISRAAAQAGVMVISGGALGIDLMAHQETLHLGGQSLAVLGVGMRHIPRRLLELSQKGLGLLSPFNTEMRAHRWTFPKRNQWISRLAGGVIVVQAGRTSGSLSTARFALKRGIPTWVVPGPISHPLHQGCYTLLDEGAQLLTSPQKWLTHAPWSWRCSSPFSRLEPSRLEPSRLEPSRLEPSRLEPSRLEPSRLEPSRLEPSRLEPSPLELFKEINELKKLRLWEVCSPTPSLLSDLAHAANLSISDAMSEATLLELDGWIQAYPGGRYARVK